MSNNDGSSSKKGLSSEQLNDVRDVLRRPLTGKAILVPFGTKAFFSGTLQPSVDSNGQERVVVSVPDGSQKEMTRQDALDLLQEEIEAQKPSKMQPERVEKRPSPTTAPQTRDAGYRPSSSSDTSAALPYFEIREELDESGTQISGEAINVTQQLECLESNGETKISGSESVPVNDALDQAYNETIPEDTSELKHLSDQEYESLSARLEELARLEEKAAHEKVSNQKSARQLQSKGWSKGFLNSKPRDKKPKASPSQYTTSQSKASQAQPEPSTGRKEAFQEENQIKEIPRVGERSVSEIRKPIESNVFSGVLQERVTRPGPPREYESDRISERPTRSAASKPIDESVLSGVVQERSAKTRSQPQEAPSKKKLSRFAQERQQYR